MGTEVKWYGYHCLNCDQQAWITVKHAKNAYIPQMCETCTPAHIADNYLWQHTEEGSKRIYYDHWQMLEATVN